MSWHWLLRTALSEAEALEQTLGATGVSLVGYEELGDVDDGIERILHLVAYCSSDQAFQFVFIFNLLINEVKGEIYDLENDFDIVIYLGLMNFYLDISFLFLGTETLNLFTVNHLESARM